MSYYSSRCALQLPHSKTSTGEGTLDDVCVFWVCDCRRRKDDACNVQLDLLGDWRLTVGLANLKNVLVPLKIILTTHLCNWMSVLHQKTYTRKWYQGHTFQSAVSNPSPLKSAFNADHGFVSSALSILLLYKMFELLTSDLFHANLRWNIFISTPFIENQ